MLQTYLFVQSLQPTGYTLQNASGYFKAVEVPMLPFAIRVFQHPQSCPNFRLRQMHTRRELDRRGLKNASVAIRIITLPS